ncbi:MAG: hypothetical protein ACPL1F_00215 [bacterium]
MYHQFGEIIGKLEKKDNKYIFKNNENNLEIILNKEDIKKVKKINKKKVFKDVKDNLEALEKLALEALLSHPNYITYFNTRARLGKIKNIELFSEIKRKIKQGKILSPKKIDKKIIEYYLQKTRDPEEVILFLNEKYDIITIDEINLYKPSLMAITGLNGHGKSFFTLNILKKIHNIKPELKIGYLINEDFTLPIKISKDFEFINFHIPANYEALLYLVEEYDIVVIDAFSNIDILQDVRIKDNFSSNSYFNNALIDLYTLTHSKNSIIILIVHLTKEARQKYVNNNKERIPSIFEAYTGRLTIYIDIGMVIYKKENDLTIDIQKNRFESPKRIYMDFQNILEEVINYEE